MAFCICSGTLKNTGTTSRQKVIEDGSILIAVPLVADDGTKNQILSTDTLDSTFIDGKLNEADPSKRWYPIGEFKNVTDERADPITESFSDGSNAVVQQSPRTWVGWLINYAAAYINKLRGFGCYKFGVYVVDDCGGLIGSISKDGLALNPIKVNEASWYPTLMKKTDTTAAKVQLSFEFSQLEADENLRVIEASEIDYDLVDISGLLDISAVISNESNTGFDAVLSIDYDQVFTPIPAKGWVSADFELYNVTQDTTVPITSVTESTDGNYAFVFAPQAANDVLTLTGVKSGFALSETINLP